MKKEGYRRLKIEGEEEGVGVNSLRNKRVGVVTKTSVRLW